MCNLQPCNFQHAQSATCAICNMCKFQHMQIATHANCNTCKLQHVQIATHTNDNNNNNNYSNNNMVYFKVMRYALIRANTMFDVSWLVCTYNSLTRTNCNMCKLQHLQFKTHAIYNTCNLQHM